MLVRVGGRTVGCGCDARRQVIFEYGGAGVPEAAVLIGAAALLVVAWKYGHRN